MPPLHPGRGSALLVVDAQVAVMKNAWQADAVLSTLNQAVANARAAGMPVIWIQHDDADLVADSADGAWAPPLRPAPHERQLRKHFNSAFEETPLDTDLAALGVKHLLLGGASTNWCIRATAYGALERGYDLTLIADAHTTQALDLGPGQVVEPAALILDLNAAMTWLSYPGRQLRACPLAEIDFADPTATHA